MLHQPRVGVPTPLSAAMNNTPLGCARCHSCTPAPSPTQHSTALATAARFSPTWLLLADRPATAHTLCHGAATGAQSCAPAGATPGPPIARQPRWPCRSKLRQPAFGVHQFSSSPPCVLAPCHTAPLLRLIHSSPHSLLAVIPCDSKSCFRLAWYLRQGREHAVTRVRIGREQDRGKRRHGAMNCRGSTSRPEGTAASAAWSGARASQTRRCAES